MTKYHLGAPAFLPIGAEAEGSAAFSARPTGLIISPPSMFRQEVRAVNGECQDVLIVLRVRMLMVTYMAMWVSTLSSSS